MAGRLAHGWAMARASSSVLRAYPRLAILPAVSGGIMLLLVAPFVLSLFPQTGPLNAAAQGMWAWLGRDTVGTLSFFAAVFAVIYVITAVAVFCNAALIYCAAQALAGRTPSIRDGLTVAAGRAGKILGWAFVAATVGVALKALEAGLKELGFIGDIISSLFAIGWAAFTYFVVPVLVMENLGPIGAVRRSTAILRSKWGESVAGEARFGLIGFLFYLQAALLFFGGLALLLQYPGGGLATLGVVLMAAGVVYGVAITVVLQTLSAVFQTGVFLYASTGQVPATMDAGLIEGAFRPKK